MNAIVMLELQHREVEDLFDELDSVTSPDARFTVFAQIADALAIHAAIEEKHFYPAVSKRPTMDILLDSVEEHLEIKRLIADLLTTDARHEDFDGKLQILRDDVGHHVRQEENELFPRVKRLFDERTLNAVGASMAETQLEMRRTGNPRDAIPGQTDIAAPH
jgi:hemerythrin superfamily protein